MKKTVFSYPGSNHSRPEGSELNLQFPKGSSNDVVCLSFAYTVLPNSYRRMNCLYTSNLSSTDSSKFEGAQPYAGKCAMDFATNGKIVGLLCINPAEFSINSLSFHQFGVGMSGVDLVETIFNLSTANSVAIAYATDADVVCLAAATPIDTYLQCKSLFGGTALTLQRLGVSRSAKKVSMITLSVNSSAAVCVTYNDDFFARFECYNLSAPFAAIYFVNHDTPSAGSYLFLNSGISNIIGSNRSYLATSYVETDSVIEYRSHSCLNSTCAETSTFENIRDSDSTLSNITEVGFVGLPDVANDFIVRRFSFLHLFLHLLSPLPFSLPPTFFLPHSSPHFLSSYVAPS